jgi:ABC-type polysaccharide/polyol phosphate transport system ATPase subunit
MSPIDISVANVSKRYRIPASRADGARSLLSNFYRKREIWALEEVSFEVSRGEALGIVGDNGAGKSTLVKLLSGITVPTVGEVIIRGTLSALVEVGAGFNIELTGRENIFLGGAILGMDRREIGRKLADIIEFSGMGDQIDAPVKTYSSGQFLRLGFSIAAQLEHQIFILDEVLAVGDISFQERCFARIDGLRRAGRTIVLISHDLAAIEHICDRAILLNKGRLLMTGEPRAVIDEYARATFVAASRTPAASTVAKLVEIAFEGPEKTPIRTGGPMAARISFLLTEPVQDPVVTVSFYWPSGYLCTQLTSAGLCHEQWVFEGWASWKFACPMLAMQRGFYRVDLSLTQGGKSVGHWRCCSLLRVEPGKASLGDYYLEHSCQMTAKASADDRREASDVMQGTFQNIQTKL